VTRLQKTLLAVLLILPLLFAVGVVGLYGLASSERGSRFLLAQAEPLLSQSMTWSSVEGSLLESLKLTGIKLAQPGLIAEIDTLTIAWQPLALLGRTLDVRSMSVKGVRVTLAESADAPDSSPFNPNSLSVPGVVQLNDIAVEDIAVTDVAGVTQRIERVTLAGEVAGNRVNLEQLVVEAQQGAVQLQVKTQLSTVMPLELSASLRWQPDDALGAVSAVTDVSGTLDWQRGTAFDLSYAVSASGLSALSAEIPEQLTLKGILIGGYQDDAIEFERFILALEETSLELVMSGGLSHLSADSPIFALRAGWSHLQWPLISPDPQTQPDVSSAQGEFSFEGVLEDYQLEFFAELAGAELPDSSWRGQGAGDLQHLDLKEVQGSLLGGQVTVAGPVWWEPLPRWQLAIDLVDIDPGVYEPDFPGLLTGSLSTSGSLDAEDNVDAGIEVQALTGELMGYPLELTTVARVQGQQVDVATLLVSSGNNRLDINGLFSEQVLDVVWQLQANEPGVFLSGARGALDASGVVAGTVSEPVIKMKASARQLALDTLSVFDVSVDASAGMSTDDALRLTMSTGPVSSEGEIVLNAFSLRGSGTNAKHTLSMNLESQLGKAQSSLKGGISDDLTAWAGELLELGLRGDSVGSWQLQAPSTLAVSADEVQLGDTCVALLNNEDAVCVKGGMTPAGDSQFDARIKSVSIARWVPAVTGVVSGELRGSLAANGQIRGASTVRMSDGTLEVPLESGSQLLAHGGGSIQATVNQSGLSAHVEFAAPQEGTLQADLAIPGLSTLPLDESLSLKGHVVATLPDLVGFAAWLPEVSSVAGALNADLALAGSIAKPELSGEFELTDGAADIPVAGISLRNIVVSATTDATAPGRIVLKGGLESGEGRLELLGEADMADGTADVNLSGDRLLVFNTRDAEVVLASNIDIRWKDETLILRGDINVPRANITPKLSLSQAAQGDNGDSIESSGPAIAVSPDVVIVNGSIDVPTDNETMASATPVRIDSQLRLLLGDRVRINSLGFISRITGDVLFTNTPDQVDLIPTAKGSFAIEDGTFRAFGQDLEIEEGRILFANVPATEPELNLRAVRWIDNDPEVSAAGVLLTGSVTAPELELFSRPQLDASEIQSYLLTGRSAGDRDSVLSIGTYVSRRVYVGYGYNLLESTSEFNSLFSITPRYGVGANVGEADNNINLTFTLEH